MFVQCRRVVWGIAESTASAEENVALGSNRTLDDVNDDILDTEL